jgi:hypothetical protein
LAKIPRCDALAWNRAATRTFIDFARIKEADRNILLFALTGHFLSCMRASSRTTTPRCAW